MSGLSVPTSKVDDGTTTAAVSGAAALASTEAAGAGHSADGKAYTGDTVGITGAATGTYNSQDVATASTVTFGGLALAGADASNYDLMLHSPASATITAANPVPTVVLNASSIPIAAPLISMMPTMNLAPPTFSVEVAMPSTPPAPLPAPAPGPANAAALVTNAAEPGPISPVSVNGSDTTIAAPAQSPVATVYPPRFRGASR